MERPSTTIIQPKKTVYKYCVVPECRNTIRNAPDKVFFLLPRGANIRRKWFQIMKKDLLSPKSCLYCCEDHFDIEEDTENYIRYKIMKLQENQKITLRLKKGIVPHKFQCQKNTRSSPPVRKSVFKRKPKETLEKSASPTKRNTVSRSMPTTFSCRSASNTTKKQGRLKKQREILIEDGEKTLQENIKHLEVGETPSESSDPNDLPIGLKCNICSGEIHGFRYVCVQCSDWDMCGGCEARGEHPQHYVLRVPELHDQEIVTSMIEALQKQLNEFLHDLEKLQEQNEPEIKVEFESFEAELDPLYEDVNEEFVVPQFTSSTVEPEPFQQIIEAPSSRWPVLTLCAQKTSDTENEKHKLQMYVESQPETPVSETDIKLEQENSEDGIKTRFSESKSGKRAGKRKIQEPCITTRVSNVKVKLKSCQN